MSNWPGAGHIGSRPIVTSLDLLRHRNVEGYASHAVPTLAYEQLAMNHPKHLGRFIACKLFSRPYQPCTIRYEVKGKVKVKRKVGDAAGVSSRACMRLAAASLTRVPLRFSWTMHASCRTSPRS